MLAYRWCERSENESRKKTTSFSSYSIASLITAMSRFLCFMAVFLFFRPIHSQMCPERCICFIYSL